MELCEQIKQTRLALRQTQEQLGAALGVPVAFLAQWERGEASPEHPRLLELALQQVQFDHGVWLLDEPMQQRMQQSITMLEQSKRELEMQVSANA